MKFQITLLIALLSVFISVDSRRHHGGHHGGEGGGGDSSRRKSLEDSLKEAENYQNDGKSRNKHKVSRPSPGGRLQSLQRARPELLQKGQAAGGLGQASSHLEDSGFNPDDTDFSDTDFGKKACNKKPDCSAFTKAAFRTMDGSCNNINNGLLGMAGIPFKRLLNPAYSDKRKRFAPRDKGRRGDKLPSAREISQKVFQTNDMDDSEMALMVMQWGQFLDHDITLTPTSVQTNDDGTVSGIGCCDENGKPIPDKERHPECFHIKIPESDPMRAHGIECMGLVRSMEIAGSGCRLRARQQMNAITSFIDASMVYGSSENELKALRSDQGTGRLMETQTDGLLPAADSSEECPTVQNKPCFRAGDIRVNEQSGLTLMHTVWVREHNRISDLLQAADPSLSDERNFQLTRRLVAAEIQHITYNEFLPVVLGKTYMEANKLNTDADVNGQYPFVPLYDPDTDPSINNAFATAAYRFGHSLIKGMLQVFKPTETEIVSLDTQFFSPQRVYQKDFRAGMCSGLGRSFSQKTDGIFVDEIVNKLFKAESDPVGLDLTALNIQRGRDHGLPPYNKYREACGLSEIKSFDDLDFSQEIITALKNVYDSVDDIDLFVGGIMEKTSNGAKVGPTFQCIIGRQFKELKSGDRYFYDHSSATHPYPFTQQQLSEIKSKVTMASVACANMATDGMDQVQENMFLRANTSPPMKDCSSISQPDISLFAS